MVRILRYLLLTAVMTAFSVVPAVHAASFHTPRDGDRLHPGIANPMSLLISVTDSTRTVVLTPSEVSSDGSGDASVYIDGDTISNVLFSTKHRFLIRSDTLSISSPSGTTEAVLTLYSDTGIRLSDPKDVHAGLIPQSVSLPIPSGFKGVALLRVDCGSESYTIKTIR